MSSNNLCKACVMLEGLNKGLPKLAVGNSQMQKTLLENNDAVGPVLQNMKDLKMSKEIKQAKQIDF